MKIGIVSDSHSKAGRLRKALEAFAERNVDAVVHCGDLGSGECMELLGQFAANAYAVAGNMDRHVDRLAEIARQCGVHFGWEVIEVPLSDGRHLVATHGHDQTVLGELIAWEQFPYVCHGHTHKLSDEKRGEVRVINPGALTHPRRPHHPTAVVLNTETDALEVVDVKR